MREDIKYRLRGFDWLIIALGWTFFTLMMRLNRFEIRGKKFLEVAVAMEKPVLVGMWHSRLLYNSWVMRKYRPTFLVSHSRDGELATQIVRLWGWDVIRGSSRQGAKRALRSLMQLLSRPDTILAVTLDGPKGPPRVAKAGSLAVAARKKATVIPFSATATRRWVLEKSWDRFQVPKPFGKIICQFGPPIPYDPKMPAEDFARMVGDRTIELERQVDALAAQLA
ncbi:MAG: DUF374 domain-containing protein [Candidatus Neomarinimicrobiota bacterium]